MSRDSRELDIRSKASGHSRRPPRAHPYLYNHVYDDRTHQEKQYWYPPVDYYGGHRRRMESPARDRTTSSDSSKSGQKSMKKVTSRFAEKTSMQGVSYIHTTKRLSGRIIWIFLLLGAIGAMIFHLYFLCDQYFLWPKQTKITLGYSDLKFPAITICNVNVLRQSQLRFASRPLRDFVSKVSPDMLMMDPPPANDQSGNGNGGPNGGNSPPPDGNGSSPPPPNGNNDRKKRFADGLNDINFTTYDDYDYYLYEYEEEAIDEWQAPPEKSQQTDQTFERLYMKESRKQRLKMGHHMKDMLVSCSFDGKTCYADNFTVFQTSDYGTCFTIQSTKMVAKSSGPRNGLVLVLYTENHEYLEGITTGYGARVVIHDRDTFPFPSDDGFYISTNAETHIGMRMVQISRQGSPYGSCDSGTSFKGKYGIGYSRQGCQAICQQEKMIESCKCFQLVSDEINKILKANNTPPCQKKHEVVCMEKILKSKACTCLSPCEEEDYVVTISSRQWPSNSYANLLKHSICEKRPKSCGNISSYGDDWNLSLNFLKLAIYYEDLNHEIVTEEPEIEPSQFASDVGGALGLWIGLSILSMFEVFQFVTEIIEYLIWKCASKTPEQRRRNGHDIEMSNDRRGIENESYHHDNHHHHGYK